MITMEPGLVSADAVRRYLAATLDTDIRRFAEVQLVCPADVCVTRERAVRWRLFGCPERSLAAAPTYGPDIALAYEHALCPELTIRTDVEDPWSAAETVVRLTLRLHEADSARVA